MVLTSNVSPPGRYSVRIVASSGVEETVTYTITDTDTDGKNAKKYEITDSMCFSSSQCSSTGSCSDYRVSSCDRELGGGRVRDNKTSY